MEKGKIYTSPLFVVRVLLVKAEVAHSLHDRGLSERVEIAETEDVRLHRPARKNMQFHEASSADRAKNDATKAFTTTLIRISAVAPKKVAPTAVLRNKLRRQIYEAVKPLYNSLASHTSIIIFAKNETAKTDVKNMTIDLKNLFSKAKISV